MSRRAEDLFTREDLVQALLEAPLPLLRFVDDKDELADPDYKAWYDQYVTPLREALGNP